VVGFHVLFLARSPLRRGPVPCSPSAPLLTGAVAAPLRPATFDLRLGRQSLNRFLNAQNFFHESGHFSRLPPWCRVLDCHLLPFLFRGAIRAPAARPWRQSSICWTVTPAMPKADRRSYPLISWRPTQSPA